MNKTIELLKEKGIIERIQKSIDEVKPPVGTQDGELIASIKHMVIAEILVGSRVSEEEVFDAMLQDLSARIFKELQITYCPKEEFEENAKEVVMDLLDRILSGGKEHE